MRLPMRVHAVKIRYREQLLRRMIHGRFGNYQGKPCVYIHYDPKDKELTRRTQKRYFLDSALGKKYTPHVERFLKVKAEYDLLLVDWRSTYSFEPPMVRFPICNTYDPHHMDNDFFASVAHKVNKMPVENPVYSGDDVLKSKNEQFAKDFFKDNGIPYKYEPDIEVDNPEGFVPDFLLSLYEIDRCIYAEVCGMADSYEYSARTAHKINFYSKNRYRPGREMIYAFMYDKNNFDEEYFAAQVWGAFDTLIPDSALDWDNCVPPCITGK